MSGIRGRERYPDFWDVKLGWIPGPGEMGCYAETGSHISVDQCATAEQAIAMCRKARHVVCRKLTTIDVTRREGGYRP